MIVSDILNTAGWWIVIVQCFIMYCRLGQKNIKGEIVKTTKIETPTNNSLIKKNSITSCDFM